MKILTVTAGPRGKTRQYSTRAWHIRQKAVRRERREYSRRFHVFTIELVGLT